MIKILKEEECMCFLHSLETKSIFVKAFGNWKVYSNTCIRFHYVNLDFLVSGQKNNGI